jgi:hypothetical protein
MANPIIYDIIRTNSIPEPSNDTVLLNDRITDNGTPDISSDDLVVLKAEQDNKINATSNINSNIYINNKVYEERNSINFDDNVANDINVIEQTDQNKITFDRTYSGQQRIFIPYNQFSNRADLFDKIKNEILLTNSIVEENQVSGGIEFIVEPISKTADVFNSNDTNYIWASEIIRPTEQQEPNEQEKNITNKIIEPQALTKINLADDETDNQQEATIERTETDNQFNTQNLGSIGRDLLKSSGQTLVDKGLRNLTNVGSSVVSSLSNLLGSSGSQPFNIKNELNALIYSFDFAPEVNYNFALEFEKLKNDVVFRNRISNKMNKYNFRDLDTAKFNVLLDNFSTYLQLQLVSVDLPNSESSTTDFKGLYGTNSLGSYISSFNNEQEINLKFYASHDQILYTFFLAWQNIQYDITTRKINYPSAYKTDANINVYIDNYYDGNINNAVLFLRYNLKDAFIVSVNKETQTVSKEDEERLTYFNVKMKFRSFDYELTDGSFNLKNQIANNFNSVVDDYRNQLANFIKTASPIKSKALDKNPVSIKNVKNTV